MSKEMLEARLKDDRARHKAEREALEQKIERLEQELKELKTPKPQYHLYEVTNGYQGYVPVNVQVMAENEKKAWTAASIAFRHHSNDKGYNYDSDFWLDLKVRLIQENAGTHECTFEVRT